MFECACVYVCVFLQVRLASVEAANMEVADRQKHLLEEQFVRSSGLLFLASGIGGGGGGGCVIWCW